MLELNYMNKKEKIQKLIWLLSKPVFLICQDRGPEFFEHPVTESLYSLMLDTEICNVLENMGIKKNYSYLHVAIDSTFYIHM